MKINKGNPVHWLYLVAFGINVACAILLRPFLHRRKTGRVLLYGHKRAGNLLALHEQAAVEGERLDVAFLTMDPGYFRELRAEQISAVLAISPRAVLWLATTDALVSDHGLHVIEWMLGKSDMKFYDVWHGIPFKGFDADDFKIQHRYDETWVASPLLQAMYVQRFGFTPERVQVTGYARTDRLVRPRDQVREVKRSLGLPADARIVLFAPTWKQDSKNRTCSPFGAEPDHFIRRVTAVAKRHEAILVVRAHLNSNDALAHGVDGVVEVGFADFPDTEKLLSITDVLVCDWSSIAFDYLLTERPTIFLDVDAPFAKGFSLDPSFRFGEVVGGLEALTDTLDRYLADPSSYARDHGERAAKIRELVYGPFADGHAASRCLQRLVSATS